MVNMFITMKYNEFAKMAMKNKFKQKENQNKRIIS